METESREIGQPALVPVQERIITFGLDGLPTLTVRAVLTKASIKEAYLVAAAQPYTGPGSEPGKPFYGMTCVEVMIRKQMEGAAGSGDASLIEIVMDRLIDKPKSSSENVTVHDTYEGALARIQKKTQESRVITVEADVFGDLAA